MHREAPATRQVSGSALPAAFDPLIWERGRTERVLDFRCRIACQLTIPAGIPRAKLVQCRRDLLPHLDSGQITSQRQYADPFRDEDRRTRAMLPLDFQRAGKDVLLGCHAARIARSAPKRQRQGTGTTR